MTTSRNITVDSTSITISQMVSLVRNVGILEGMSYLFLGSTGISKSESVFAECRATQNRYANFGACGINLGGAQGVDLVGWPQPSDGPISRNGAPTWMQPDRRNGLRGAFPVLCPEELMHSDQAIKPIPEAQLTRADMRTYKFGVCVLDDATAVPSRDVFQPLAQIFNTGYVGSWGLEGKWCTVGMGNDVQHRSDAMEMPMHLRGRLLVYQVRATFADLEPYWLRRGMNACFLSFAATHAGTIFSNQVPVENMQFPSPRSWFNAWRAVMRYCETVIKLPNVGKATFNGKPVYDPGLFPALMSGDDTITPETREHALMIKAAVSAACGEGTAGEFQTYLVDSQGRPTLAEIVLRPKKAKLSENTAVQHSIIYGLLNELEIDAVEDVCPYIGRMHNPMIGLFVTRALERFGPELSTQDRFMDLIDKGGVAAQVNAYNAAVGWGK
jgi:hypothetical protein